MMRVALHDNDATGYPNLALMKISAYHRAQGDTVEWFSAVGGRYDRVYSSKVFTWSKSDPYLPEGTIFGGTGHDVETVLNDVVELLCPDYTLYSCTRSYGFLTRGCIRSCAGCFVPRKEGAIRPHQDVEAFARHRDVVIMDNNVLAHSYGLEQIDKMASLCLRVDFNQGLDARLIDDSVARRLGKLKWIRHIRLACDSEAMIEPVRKAVELLRWHNVNPAQIFCYVLVRDVESALEIVRFLKGMYVLPFAQPYRDREGTEPTKKQRDFARWVNMRAAFKATTWEKYKKVRACFRDSTAQQLNNLSTSPCKSRK